MKLTKLRKIFNSRSKKNADLWERMNARLDDISTRLLNVDERMETFEVAMEEVLIDTKVKQFLPVLFPDQAAVNATIDKTLNNYQVQNQPIKNYTEKYLPYHTNDNEWLANYTAAVINHSNYKIYLNPWGVQSYIEKSADFDQARRNYQERLVKACIHHEVGETLVQKLPTVGPAGEMLEYDEIVPFQVESKARALGIDYMFAREVMATNHKMWRQQAMLKTFRDYYYPYLKKPRSYQPNLENPDAEMQLWNLKQAHEELWLKNREYEYYQKHQDLVDKLGLVTPNMLPTAWEKNSIPGVLQHYEEQRLKYLAQPQFTARLTHKVVTNERGL